MKKHLAHALRRTARRMIAWSNRLDAPTDLGRQIGYAGQRAGIAVAGLLEAVDAQARLRRPR